MVFQFSPALGGERNTPVLIAFHKSVGVSILTRPWGRVQLRVSVGYWSVVTRSFNSHPPLGASATHPDALLHRTMHVSILTRPWGRVQRILQWIDGVFFEFQFSPALGGECNPTRQGAGHNAPRPRQFQFSPALGGECNGISLPQTPHHLQVLKPDVRVLDGRFELNALRVPQVQTGGHLGYAQPI